MCRYCSSGTEARIRKHGEADLKREPVEVKGLGVAKSLGFRVFIEAMLRLDPYIGKQQPACSLDTRHLSRSYCERPDLPKLSSRPSYCSSVQILRLRCYAPCAIFSFISRLSYLISATHYWPWSTHKPTICLTSQTVH